MEQVLCVIDSAKGDRDRVIDVVDLHTALQIFVISKNSPLLMEKDFILNILVFHENNFILVIRVIYYQIGLLIFSKGFSKAVAITLSPHIHGKWILNRKSYVPY